MSMCALAGKRFAALLATAVLAAVGACDSGVDPLAVATVVVRPGADTLTALVEAREFSAVARNAAGDRIGRAVFTWASSDTSVATVNQWGQVRAAGNGVARITATVTGVTGTAVVTVRQAIATVRFVQQPGNVSAGDTLSPVTVWLLDSGGHKVTDTVVAVTLALGRNPGAATLAGTTTVTTVDGIATFSDLSMLKAGSGYTLVATVPGQDSVTSGGFTVVPGPVVLEFLTQPGTAEGQVFFQPPVQVAAKADRFGNSINAYAQVLVDLSASPTGDTLRGHTSVYLADGVATFGDLHLARPGDGYVLRASGGYGLPAIPVTSDSFAVRLKFVDVVAGASYSCGVTVPGFAYCWGANDAGQLGDGTTEQRLTPTPVAPGSGGAVQLSASTTVSCKTTGPYGYLASCWGSNSEGQLGNGTTIQSSTPQRLPGLLAWLQLSTGELHTCGVTLDHAAYCWGSNTYGQLGDSTTTERLSPVPVSDSLPFVQISAGSSHTCGVTTANAAYCWGSDSSGQLGDGGTQDRLTPTPVQGGLSFVQVSAGDGYTCGLATDSTAYCWGANGSGQLGDGTTQERPQPTAVSGGLRFGSVSAGWGHTCGVAAGGAAYCWGDNADGQLGDGSTSQRLQPTPVTGTLTFLQVSAVSRTPAAPRRTASPTAGAGTIAASSATVPPTRSSSRPP